MQQLGLIEGFTTSKAANPIYCHQEFLEKLSEQGRSAIGRRAAFLMQRLSVDARRLHYKTTHGANRGWRRSRLGGNQGSHFYAWWAPRNALPLKEAGGFTSAPGGAIFLRDIRHHDDHSPLAPQSYESHYMPVTVRDLRREEYAPLPWTQPQARFASARQPVRLLKGHPGSGKTTALWNAADSTGAERVLYVTYSPELAALARDYFDRFCSSHKRFDVITLPNLVQAILGAEVAVPSEQESRKRFRHDLVPYARILGPWANNQMAFYDELHAHLAGDALPVAIGRFGSCDRPRVSDKLYRERRTRHLGEAAAEAALAAATRLERSDSGGLSERYFPAVAFAWQAVARLRRDGSGGAGSGVDPSFSEFDCIAVDECQDLTPIEAFLVVELASRINRQRRVPIPLLLAGDEAQTVRPTDFEWGWLSDLLHAQVGTPTEYKLTANLRSPRRIATLVNRVWHLYSHLEKQERPSGTGYSEIEDDATDQILYCTATAGPELNELLVSLSKREGLALVTLEDMVPSFVPEDARNAVLTISQAKGLDFHSVCVLDAGRHVEQILRENSMRRGDTEIELLRKRLAIDQLRVALSRPTERLFWLDVNPTDAMVRQSVSFLNGEDSGGGVSSCVPHAMLKALEEDELDAEERVQRCQTDARQYLHVKPEIAWSRAQQAITLLGPPGALMSVTDESARQAAYLTLAEVCFMLAIGNTRLAPELGRPDLFLEASRAARNANRFGLGAILDAIGRVHRVSAEDRIHALVHLAQIVPRNRKEIESWLAVEMSARSKRWLEELEGLLFNGHNATVLTSILPPFYEALDVPDRVARIERLQQRAIQVLIKDKQFITALELLQALPERQPKLEAACHEGAGDFRRAAECHLAAGNPKDALSCYRSIPDLDAALQLLQNTGEHPAAESLQWMSRVRDVLAKRPGNFNKTVTAAEKKLLEEMLEKGLGVTRRKPAPRKAAKKTVAKKPPAPRKRPLK